MLEMSMLYELVYVPNASPPVSVRSTESVSVCNTAPGSPPESE